MHVFRFLLFVLLVIVAVKLSEVAYGLVAYRDERALARELRVRLLDAGAALVERERETETLRQAFFAEDEALARSLPQIRRLHGSVRQGVVTGEDYRRYSEEVDRYNLQLRTRNTVQRELGASLGELRTAEARYRALSDSLYAVALQMRRPYYQTPTALEAADERRRGPR